MDGDTVLPDMKTGCHVVESNGPNLNSNRFVNELQPAFDQGDLRWAHEVLRDGWPISWLIQLLMEGQEQAKKLAVMSLGLVGDTTAIGPLIRSLQDRDPQINELADNSLRCIWCRCGKKQSTQFLKQGNNHLNHGNTDAAIERFSMAIQNDPDFAEAYNQRAIAYSLADRFYEAIVDYRETVRRVPEHFVAIANLGHCYTNIGDFVKARECYEQALMINPHLEGVESAIEMIDQIINNRGQVA